MQTANAPCDINQARTLANIAERAKTITDDYRLVWSLFDQCFMVTHKRDRTRRYKVTAAGCTCPARANYGTCKHWQGLRALVQVEIDRYTLLGLHDKRARLQTFVADIRALRSHRH